MKINNTDICAFHEEVIIWHEAPYSIVKCKKCGLIYQNPQPDVTNIYKKDYFSNNYIRYTDERVTSFRNRWQDLKKLFPASGKLLDVGSGAGFFLKVAKENNWQAIGVEPSAFARDYSVKEFGLEIYPDISALIEKQYKFDVITIWDVIAHLPAPYEYMAKITSLLKPGGLLIIKTPYYIESTFRFISLIGKFVKTSFFVHVPQQLYFFNDSNIQLLFQKNVFDVVEFEFTKEARLKNVVYSNNKLKHAIVKILKVLIALVNMHESFVVILRKNQ